MESHARAFYLNRLYLNEMNQWAVGSMHRDPLRVKGLCSQVQLDQTNLSLVICPRHQAFSRPSISASSMGPKTGTELIVFFV